MSNKNPKSVNPSRKNVFVNVETDSRFGRDIIEGIISFSLEHSWNIRFESRTLTAPLPAWFPQWEGNGIISRSGSINTIRKLAQKNCPRVELVGSGPEDEPEIAVDRQEVAAMIFNHFYERAFRQFAVYSFNETWWSLLEKQCYIELLKSRGFPCHSFRVKQHHGSFLSQNTEEDRDRLREWLLELPKPVGIYALLDSQAVPVLQTCRLLGFSVPDEVAVVGVENDEWLCSITDPPLSSVDQNGKKIGYLAAKLLADRMDGQRLKHEHLVVPPLFLKTRQSSDCIAIDDEDFVDVLKYIREQACHGLTVNEVVDYSNRSHTSLVCAFRKWRNRTIEQEIKSVRIEYAKQLLQDTKLSIQAVGKAAGFNSPGYFCYSFRKYAGVSPQLFRSVKGRQN